VAEKLPSLISFRPYQRAIFDDDTSGVVIAHWSRQIGKSYVLAAWAVKRLLTRPGRLVTVLSNSRDNGAEFLRKVDDVCRLLGVAVTTKDTSPDGLFANMRMEVRLSRQGKTGRIKVLAANPRTARGFSGDLILDEFAFHEDSAAIWEAAEPILSSNPDFLCRIASTGNGKHNLFYRMVSRAEFKVSRVSRSSAWALGLPIYDPVTRQPITPDEARKKALDKRAYDQNYELSFADENMALLTHELISAAERSLIAIDDQQWSAASCERLVIVDGDLFVGNDIGRHRDLSVVSVLESCGRAQHRVVAMLRMSGLRLPDQQRQIEQVCRLPNFRAYEGDMTGIGLGLVEYLQEQFGTYRVRGVNFSSKEPISEDLQREGRKGETAGVTELMASALVRAFEDRAIAIPVDAQLRDDLRKPEKITSPGGRVGIAAARDEAGHADHFWSLALALRAARTLHAPGTIRTFDHLPRNLVIAARRTREVLA
jgi:phage FluMu gp28-like protein